MYLSDFYLFRARGAGAKVIRSIDVLYRSNYRLRIQGTDRSNGQGRSTAAGCITCELVGSEAEHTVNIKSEHPGPFFALPVCSLPLAAGAQADAYVLLRLSTERWPVAGSILTGIPLSRKMQNPFQVGRLLHCLSVTHIRAESGRWGSSEIPV